jgi:hypothetical protein
MNVYSTELGIRLSFVKTLEFRGVGVEPPKPPQPGYVIDLYGQYGKVAEASL